MSCAAPHNKHNAFYEYRTKHCERIIAIIYLFSVMLMKLLCSPFIIITLLGVNPTRIVFLHFYHFIRTIDSDLGKFPSQVAAFEMSAVAKTKCGEPRKIAK